MVLSEMSTTHGQFGSTSAGDDSAMVKIVQSIRKILMTNDNEMNDKILCRTLWEFNICARKVMMTLFDRLT